MIPYHATATPYHSIPMLPSASERYRRHATRCYLPLPHVGLLSRLIPSRTAATHRYPPLLPTATHRYYPLDTDPVSISRRFPPFRCFVLIVADANCDSECSRSSTRSGRRASASCSPASPTSPNSTRRMSTKAWNASASSTKSSVI